MKNRNDRSYMEDVFECIASDKLRVVAKRLTGRPAMDSYTFHRRDNWIEIISLAVLTAQGFAEECECVRARCHDCCCCV